MGGWKKKESEQNRNKDGVSFLPVVLRPGSVLLDIVAVVPPCGSVFFSLLNSLIADLEPPEARCANGVFAARAGEGGGTGARGQKVATVGFLYLLKGNILWLQRVPPASPTP